MIFWFGLFVSATAGGVILWVIFKWIVGSPEPGWASIVASIWAVGGMVMASIGILGIYLKKIMAEIRQQPYTIIKEVFENHDEADDRNITRLEDRYGK